MECIKELIKQLANYTPNEFRAKYNFDNENNALIKFFAEMNMRFRDENSDYRNFYDVLKDIDEKNKQL